MANRICTDQHTEAELIALLKQGSEMAFDALYEMYAARLYGFCLAYVKSKEDAEEIVQDTFVWLWKCRTAIRQDSTLKNLLFIRAKHYLINAYRARVNSPLFEDYTIYLDSFTSENPSKLEFDEFKDKVTGVVATLPTTQAKVFSLSRFEGLRNREISDKLSLGEQTIKNALSAALKTIRAKLLPEVTNNN